MEITCDTSEIFRSDGTQETTLVMTMSNSDDWCKSADWTPTEELDSYFIEVSITDCPSCVTYVTYAPLSLIKPSLSGIAADFNWDDIGVIKASTDTYQLG